MNSEHKETAGQPAETISGRGLERPEGRLVPEVPTGERKIEHVRLCLNEEVGSVGVTTGFERYRFRHSALPEIDFEDIKLDTAFLGFPYEPHF